jgi:O-antigen ligase
MGLVAQLIANRSLPNIFVGFFVFDAQSYWYRLFIWQYGWASILNHPVFGIGLNDWERPSWMENSSVDDFWLLLAMRYGFLGASLLLLAFSSVCLALGFRKGLDDRSSAYRTAFLISMVAVFLAGWTVHYWDATYVFLLFFMGSGVWLLEGSEAKTVSKARGPSASVLPRRFGPHG